MNRSSRSALTRRLAIGFAAVGLSVITATSAEAKTVYNTDDRGDVSVMRFDDSDGDWTPAPDHANGDITRTRLWHAHKVGVLVHFRDLQRTGRMRIDELGLVTNEGVRRQLIVSASPGKWGGKATFEKVSGDAVRCKGVTHKTDFVHNTVQLTVPRRCLSNPRWVRLGYAAVTTTDDAAYIDDAIKDGPFGDDVSLSARLVQHK